MALMDIHYSGKVDVNLTIDTLTGKYPRCLLLADVLAEVCVNQGICKSADSGYFFDQVRRSSSLPCSRFQGRHAALSRDEPKNGCEGDYRSSCFRSIPIHIT